MSSVSCPVIKTIRTFCDGLRLFVPISDVAHMPMCRSMDRGTKIFILLSPSFTTTTTTLDVSRFFYCPCQVSPARSPSALTPLRAVFSGYDSISKLQPISSRITERYVMDSWLHGTVAPDSLAAYPLPRSFSRSSTILGLDNSRT
jgi:hypothetical protein